MEQHIRESNLIEGIDSVEQDRQSFSAWKWLDTQRELNATVIKRVHKILTHTQQDLAPEYKGIFRPIQVRVGDHVPPRPDLVKGAMSRWIKTFMQLDPKEAHIRFETIHPFVDGNGRVGRMLMWWHQRRLGEQPTLLKASERWMYYRWFKGRGQPYGQTDLIVQLAALHADKENKE